MPYESDESELAQAGWSTFTQLDRHLATLTCLTRSLNCRDGRSVEILLLGSGPVEPYTFAALIPPHVSARILAVDMRPDHRAMPRALCSDGVPLTLLAESSQDNLDTDGPNLWFTLSEALGAAQRVNAKTAIPCWEVVTGPDVRIKAHLPDNVRIEWLQADVISTEIDFASFDLVWAGLFLTNVRKAYGHGIARQVLRRLAESRVPLGLGSSLSPAFGISQELPDILGMSFEPDWLSLESIIHSTSGLYGDVAMVLNLPEPARSMVKPRRGSIAVPAKLVSVGSNILESWSEPLGGETLLTGALWNGHDRVSMLYAPKSAIFGDDPERLTWIEGVVEG